MEKLIPFEVADLAKITNYRNGEIKFGEKIIAVPKNVDVFEFIATCSAKYVLFGVPEDIGIRANYGRLGTASSWNATIEEIANIQHNRFCKGNQIIVLGRLDVSEEIKEIENLNFDNIGDRSKLNKLVEKVDKEVSHIVFNLVKLGKVPIIIGGSHNNSYGNIKGTALAKGESINAINFGIQSGFRILEGRHSGNGFSYAYEDGFLKKYFVFGLNENYISKDVLAVLKKNKSRVRYVTYDSIRIRKEKKFKKEMIQAKSFVDSDFFGLEVDLGSIPNIVRNSMIQTGFSVEDSRRFVSFIGGHKNVSYFHICEGVPFLGEKENTHLIGKIIGHLITDFIKSNVDA